MVALRQNAAALTFVAVWMAGNALWFSRGHPPGETLLIVLSLLRDESLWGHVHQPFTQVVVFGAVVSMIASNVLRRHRPEATARLLAAEARAHVVVIGHTHLGQRVREAAVAEGLEVVVVDDDPGRISVLLHDEAPLVLGDPREESVLLAASIARARLVVVAWEGVEVAAIAARLVRKHNPSCELVLRCPDDDVGEVLARVHQARIVSTSKLVAERVARDASKRGERRAVVFGENAVGLRTAQALRDRGLEVQVAQLSEQPAQLSVAANAELIVVADDDLGKNLVRVDRLRDVAPHARVVCRVFHEEAAEVLARAPFRCELLSSSRLGLEMLQSRGLLTKTRESTGQPLGVRGALRG